MPKRLVNQIIAGTAALFGENVVLVDLFSSFQDRSGLLLIDKKAAGFNVHPTNAGYQAMTKAFSDAMGRR